MSLRALQRRLCRCQSKHLCDKQSHLGRSVNPPLGYSGARPIRSQSDDVMLPRSLAGSFDIFPTEVAVIMTLHTV